MAFYDGNKLLTLKDINGKEPEIYICTTNRNAGKTTYFGKYLINRYKNKGEKFALLYRYDYDLEGAGEKFFSNLQALFFPSDRIGEKAQGEGKYTALFLNDKCCGYALALNNAKYYRQFSQYFSDVKRIFFDEFQPEDELDYVRNEVTKFRSLHTSLARGGGKQIRYLPVIMTGNPYSIINPYYSALGIADRLNRNTRFIRGAGWVLEQGFNESAAQAAKGSAFNQAFENHTYFDDIGQGVYLNDSAQFMQTPKGKNRYLCSLKYKTKIYGVRVYDDAGIVYIDSTADETNLLKIAVTNSDMTPNFISVNQNKYLVKMLRKYFDSGACRFKNQDCKRALFALLSIPNTK